MTRKGLARRLPAPRRRTAHAWRWCVTGGGTVAATFAHRRVVLVGTTARGHRLRKLAPGRLTQRHAISRAGTRGLVGTRGHRVRWLAVTSRRAIHRPALLRSYLRAAGLRPR
jgi:hypothetical protein